MGAYESILKSIQIEDNVFLNLKEEWATEMVGILENYKEQIHMIRKLNNKLSGSEYFPPITNFRDALFHYKLAYECDNIVTLIEQNNSIMEHLHRAVKDGITELIRTVTNIITNFYEKNKDDETRVVEISKLQHIIHTLKDKELEIRLYSLQIQRPFDNMEYFEKFIETMEDILQQLEADDWFKELNHKLTF